MCSGRRNRMNAAEVAPAGSGWHHGSMNRSVRAGLALAILVPALALAACDAGAATPGASAGASPSVASSSPSAATSAAPSGSVAPPSPTSKLVIPHADPALEALLPDEFEGKPLEKLSVDPISSAGNAGAEPIRTLAKDIGGGTGNFSLAYASNPTDPTFNCVALRIPGAASAALLSGFVALTIADTRGAEADQTTLGGKSVTHVTVPGSEIGDNWFYAKGDTLFGVQTGSPERAATLLELLP